MGVYQFTTCARRIERHTNTHAIEIRELDILKKSGFASTAIIKTTRTTTTTIRLPLFVDASLNWRQIWPVNIILTSHIASIKVCVRAKHIQIWEKVISFFFMDFSLILIVLCSPSAQYRVESSIYRSIARKHNAQIHRNER